MSEFDFDELDKAVTGALESDTPSEAEEPQANIAQTVPSTPAPAVRRGSGGRFMDVVHPSSDMRSRQTAVTVSSQTPASEPAPTPVSTEGPANEPASLPEPPVFNELEAAESETQPLESPFLPDAKVEKRPLGGLGGAIPPVPSFQSEAPLNAEAPDETVETEPATDEVLKLEAPEELFIEAEASEPAESTKSPTADVDDEVIGSISITQQYKDGQSSEKEPGAIYDTESYHQPLAHPAKKHSAVWTIVWSLILVIFGAGAGVLFYLYILPLL